MRKVLISFDKDKTVIIKGFAIVLMIILHAFSGWTWYDADLQMNHNENLLHYMSSTQICVGIFVFLIGYGYAFAADKNWQYSFKHIKKLLFVFWTVLFLLALPVGYRSISNGKELILNMFGIQETVCWVSWFVYLFIWAMIVMPFFGRLIDKKPFVWTIALMGLSYSVLVFIHELVPDFGQDVFWHSLFICFSWTPSILLGYLFARKSLFTKIKLPDHWSVTILSIAVIFLTLYLKTVVSSIAIFNFDVIYAPVVICCLLIIFSRHQLKTLSKVMSELGDKSVYMWFIHSLFFTDATRPMYHRFVMISDNLWIIAIWTLVLSYLCAAVFKKIVEY